MVPRGGIVVLLLLLTSTIFLNDQAYYIVTNAFRCITMCAAEKAGSLDQFKDHGYAI